MRLGFLDARHKELVLNLDLLLLMIMREEHLIQTQHCYGTRHSWRSAHRKGLAVYQLGCAKVDRPAINCPVTAHISCGGMESSVEYLGDHCVSIT